MESPLWKPLKSHLDRIGLKFESAGLLATIQSEPLRPEMVVYVRDADGDGRRVTVNANGHRTRVYEKLRKPDAHRVALAVVDMLMTVPANRLPYSAADTARTVSRILRRAGLPMADKSNKYRWTEGLHVFRVGCSQYVSVSYHGETLRHTVESREIARQTLAAARELLESKGYVLDKQDYIECRRE